MWRGFCGRLRVVQRYESSARRSNSPSTLGSVWNKNQGELSSSPSTQAFSDKFFVSFCECLCVNYGYMTHSRYEHSIVFKPVLNLSETNQGFISFSFGLPGSQAFSKFQKMLSFTHGNVSMETILVNNNFFQDSLKWRICAHAYLHI